ncbi:hypothetical protein ACH5RR_017181 [Cinchona calisaya]|uniref:F-box domain-containing protein n=1 Tax=Cinchona calisaya TaxID=153742 RepID=A0ABD3A0Q2_9GENT
MTSNIQFQRSKYRMGTPKERYEELELFESLNCSYRYAVACKELSFILREAYSAVPKNLQSLIFQDTLSAFRLLPKMQTQTAISAANVLLQKAESAFPKRKMVLAVTEFKNAMVSSKRCSKSQPEEEGPTHFPEDVLIHVFSYLDLQSLVSAAMVCRSWSSAASDNHLWESLYVNFFGCTEKYARVNCLNTGGMAKCKEDIPSQSNIVTGSNIPWRDNFKSVYEGVSSKKSAPYRGYCRQCNSIVWLSDPKCYNSHTGKNCKNPKVVPISMSQIIDRVLYDCPPSESSSDSDSDSDDMSVFKLWAYPG